MWQRFLRQVALAMAITLAIALAPLPVWTPSWFAYFQVPAAVTVLVCYLGKLLYDTLFWDHYRGGR